MKNQKAVILIICSKGAEKALPDEGKPSEPIDDVVEKPDDNQGE